MATHLTAERTTNTMERLRRILSTRYVVPSQSALMIVEAIESYAREFFMGVDGMGETGVSASF